MLVFRLWVWTIGHLLRYLFGSSKRSRIIFAPIFTGHSYRLSSPTLEHPLIEAVYFKQALQLLNRQGQFHQQSGNETVGLIDTTHWGMPERREYLEGLNVAQPAHYANTEDLGGGSLAAARWVTGVFLLTLLPLWILHGMFAKKRGNLALMILSMAELTIITLWVQQQRLKQLYYFGSFEIEANLTTAWMMKLGIHVTRVPSNNPLRPFYASVISNQIAFTAPFQREEYEIIKGNWLVEEFTNFPVFQYPETLRHDAQTLPEAQQTLGFFSSGVWHRKERGDNVVGVGEYEAEDIVLDYLKRFLHEQPEISLYLYLHPKEKATEEQHARATAHYQRFFELDDPSRITLDKEKKGSRFFFNRSNVAVSVYSATNTERLFTGKKTFYAPVNMGLELFQQTSLKNISLLNYDQFSTEIKKAFTMTDQEFFDHYQLEDYYRFGLPEAERNWA